MSAESIPSNLEQPLVSILIAMPQEEVAHNDPHENKTSPLRNKLLSVVTAGLVIAGGVAAGEYSTTGEAQAQTTAYGDLGYPWKDAPCQFGDAGGSQCANPNSPSDKYDWGIVDDNHVFHPYRDDGYEYRNCTDYVKWKEGTIGVNVPNTWGNGGEWYSHASASQKSDTPEVGDAAVKPVTSSDGFGHVAYVESVNGDGTITVSEYNHDAQGHGDKRTGSAASMGFTKFVDFGVHPVNSDVPGNPAYDLQVLRTPDNQVYAKTGVSNGGWNQETGIGAAGKVAVGGNTQMLVGPDGKVYARDGIGNGGWIQETEAGVGADVAISSTGVQMVLTTDSEVWAKSSVGYGGWTGESGAGTASKIAVGSNTQMIVAGDGTVYAKANIGNGGWNQETNSGVASDISVSSTGTQMILATDGEVWAKNTIGNGGWTGELGAGSASAIAIGGDTQILIAADGKVYAKNSIGNGGWNQETDANVGANIAVSSNGLQIVETTGGEIWAKSSIGYGGWTGEASPGTATDIAASS